MVDNNDLISTEIERLESELEAKRAQRTELLPQTRQLKEERDKLELLLRQVRQQFLTVENQYESNKQAIDKLDRQGKEERERLETLRRERDRLLEAKKIDAKYLEQVDAFRNSCLEALWRSENRSDGLGAKTHQIEGAIHLAVTERALLGDKRGLGKTLTSLIALDMLDAQKVIIVAPTDALDNWIREIKLWSPHRFPVKLAGVTKGQREVILGGLKRAPQYALVINFEAWKNDYTLIKDLVNLCADSMIVDESHHIMTSSSLQNKGVQDIRYGINTCPRCMIPKLNRPLTSLQEEYTCWCGHEGLIDEFCTIKHVFPMTGTSILNKPQELFPQMRLVDPKFDRERDYLRDFCKRTVTGRWVFQEGAEEGLLYKIGPRYIARDRSSAGVVIPPVEEIVHSISMNDLKSSHPLQHEAYLQVRDFAEVALNPDVAMSMPNQAVALMRLRQVLIWPAALSSEFVDEETGRVYKINLDVKESWKLDFIEQEIKELNEDGERVIVFSQFRDGMHELGRRLGERTAIYDGSTRPAVRNAIQLDFDAKTAPARPTWNNVLCNYKSAGAALNFNTANHMYLPDREWNPGKESQAIGRMDRMGQTRDSYVHKLFVGSSVDGWMDDIIEQKKNMVGGFLSEAEVMRNAYEKLRDGEM